MSADATLRPELEIALPNARREDVLFRALQILMTVIFLHHALQPLLSLAGLIPWKAKYLVAASGGFLYGTALVLLIRRSTIGLYIAIFGPMTGTAVLSTGALLMWLGWLQVEFRQDLVTILGGIPQMIALVLAILVLRGRRARS